MDTCTVSVISKCPLARVLSSCTGDLPFTCLGQIDFNTQNGFVRESNALDCEGFYLSVGILDNQDKDKLVITTTDGNSPENNPRT